MVKKIVVAIDGFSSCGKSTMAKDLAHAVGYTYIDSGAMYRAVTLYAMREGLLRQGALDEALLRVRMDMIKISFRVNGDGVGSATYLNGERVEEAIREMDVAQHVSRVASLDFVRESLVAQQQAMGAEKEMVMDGRDIGTVVFPQAELKIFVTASDEIRARRRVDEMHAKGRDASFEEVLANVRQRDLVDKTRTISPLRKADDAIELDNSYMTIEEQHKWLLTHFCRITGATI